MNIKRLLVCGVFMYATVNQASAAPFTVYLTGHITAIGDSNDIFGGQLGIGQTVTALYTYDTNVQDQNPDPMYGQYPQGMWQGAMRVSAGSFVFESDPASLNWNYNITVHPSYWPGSYQGFFRLSSFGNKALANGATVNGIEINFDDFSGQAPTSEYLPTSAPDLHSYSSQKGIFVHGNFPSGEGYGIVIAIDSASTTAPQEGAGGLVVSPATGKFLRMQHFDAALFLPQGSPDIQSVQANINGMTLPFSYGNSCYFAWNMQNVPAVICPNASWYVPDGKSHIDWRVQFIDGTVLNKSVDWEMIP